MMNQILNHIERIEDIHLDKINKNNIEANHMTEYEINIHKTFRQENGISEPNSKTIYFIIGTTIIVMMVSLGYIYIDEIPNIGSTVSNHILNYSYSPLFMDS